MDILIDALLETIRLILRIGPMLFISIFGIELIMQMGVMKKLEPLGRPLTRISNLPPQSTLTFLTAIGSIFAANTMLVQFQQDKKMTGRQVTFSAVLNAVPFHFKEILTYHFPIVLPLLGLKVCLLYVLTFWLAGMFKMLFVIAAGRMVLKRHEECDLDPDGCQQIPAVDAPIPLSLTERFKKVYTLRKRLFRKIMTIFVSVTFVVQILIHLGIMKFFENLVAPFMEFFGLPSVVAAPISVFIFSPTAGITYLSNLMQENLVTDYQAIVALLAGGYAMIPISRLRGTLPRYSAIFGLKQGGTIVSITTALSLMARTVVLIGVILLF